MSIFDTIGSLFSGSSGTAAAAAQKQAAVKTAKKGATAASEPITQGKTEALGYQKQALQPWQNLFSQGTAMSPYYMGGLGIGTPGQVSAANAAFMGSIPGQEYQNQLPSIYEAALRRGGLTGQTGQIPIDLTNETMKTLNQFYPGWQSALNPLPWETAGATGISNAYGNMASTATGAANALSNIQANKFNTLGQARAAYPANVLAANQGAAGNQLSALFGLGGLGLAAFNPAGGLGLGSLFSGQNPTPMNQVTPGTGPTLSNNDQYMYW